ADTVSAQWGDDSAVGGIPALHRSAAAGERLDAAAQALPPGRLLALCGLEYHAADG
ncbi:hypothetical protein LCGC14_0952620, partial [marine sediment metagenome]